MVLRNEIQLSLSALKPAFAKQSSRSHRDFGLNGRVTRPDGIDGRIEKDKQPFLLIRPQHVPKERRTGQRKKKEKNEIPEPNAPIKNESDQNRKKNKRRTQIRLFQNEKRRQTRQNHHHDQSPFMLNQRATHREEMMKQQNGGNFGKFRWLK